MAFWDRLTGRGDRRAAVTFEGYTSPITINGHQFFLPEIAGEGALKSPTALAAVRAVSETCGCLPLRVFSLQADGHRQQDNANPADSLLNRRPNPWTGPSELRTSLVKDALLHGRGIAVAVRVGGKVKELHRVLPGTFSVAYTPAGPTYGIPGPDGSTTEYSYRDVVDVLAPGGSVYFPENYVAKARNAIRQDILMAEFFSKLLTSGARPSAVLTAKDALTDPVKWPLMRQWLKEQMADGDLLTVPAPFEFNALTFSSVDMEFSARAAAVRIDIAAAFRVPPILLQDYGRSTWNNSEAMGQQFLQTLMPWLDAVEFAFGRVLLGDDPTHFLEHATSELVRPNVAALFAASTAATGSSTMTVNEFRKNFLNLPPIEGGDELVRQAGQSGATAPKIPAEPDITTNEK